MNNLRILIADDHGLLRRGARVLLQTRHGWKVVGEATNGREAVEKAVKLKPDVAVVDISMPELDGVEVTRQIRRSVPNTKVLVLTMHESVDMVRRALDAGAHAYLLKSDLADCLLKAVKSVSTGQRFFTPEISESVVERFLGTRRHDEHADGRLTPRENEILRHLANGRGNKEIAALLGITVRTVETYRSKIMLKLGLHSLAELIHYAMRNEIISVNGTG